MYKKILITGSEGFIGKNLSINISNQFSEIKILKFNRDDDINDLNEMIKEADFLFHLAGENRPKSADSFYEVNHQLTKEICNLLISNNKKIPVVFASTTKVNEENDYGKSKLAAEECLINLSNSGFSEVYIFRLANVFGKWCKPNYNSVVATFCHNIIRGIDISINDASSKIDLIYIDDLVKVFIDLLKNNFDSSEIIQTIDSYQTTVGELANDINLIHRKRLTQYVEDVGNGYMRALYSTYLSYLDKDNFVHDLISNNDERGNFVEMLKTKSSGQVSFFSAHPGITRGGHYHHTKNEKFLVISGKAKFRFKNMLNQEYFEINVNSDKPQIVETVPGWAHDITNIGESEMFVMLWSNEVYDEKNPDTFWEEI